MRVHGAAGREVILSPELEKIRCEFERVTRNFSGEDWLRAPEGKWSSALILEHVLLSYLSTTLGLLRAIHGGKPSERKATLRERIATLMVVGLGLFPPGRSAPKQAFPKGTLPPGSLQKVEQALAAMDTRLAAAEARFGPKVKVLDHPALGPLTTQEWRRFHRTHALHHLKQIQDRGTAGVRRR